MAERIAILGGTGHEGFGLALRWASAGYRVIIGSRDEAKARAAAEQVMQRLAAKAAGRAAGESGGQSAGWAGGHGPGQPGSLAGEPAGAAGEQGPQPAAVVGLANAEAASVADMVVLTLPFHAHPEILPALREQVRAKVVVDTTVPLQSFRPPVLQDVPEGAAAMRVQALLPQARVVAAFHTVAASKLASVERPLEQDTLVCGDDEAAKEAVGRLATAIGLRPVDAGPLSAARALEQVAALVIALNQRHKRSSIGVRFVGL